MQTGCFLHRLVSFYVVVVHTTPARTLVYVCIRVNLKAIASSFHIVFPPREISC